MNLIFIYGVPGVGKLTVAKKLSEITGYKIVHNHLTVDLIYSVFEWGSDIGEELNEKYRLDIIEKATKHRLPGLIMTFVYGHPVDEPFVKKVIHRVESNSGHVKFVRLVASKEALKERIANESRNGTLKIKTFDELEGLMAKYDLETNIKLGNNLVIDNTSKSAEDVAEEIVDYFGLVKNSHPPKQSTSHLLPKMTANQ